MKIVMICDFFSEELDYQENLLSQVYVRHGHSVTIITTTTKDMFDFVAERYDHRVIPSVTMASGVKIVRLRYKLNVFYRLRWFTSLRDILEAEAPDLIYLHDIQMNCFEAIRYLKQNKNCKMIMDYHADEGNSGRNWLSRKFLHGVIRRFYLDRTRPYLSKIFPIYPHSAAFLRAFYDVPDTEMELLPLGVDLQAIQVVRSSSAGSLKRAELGIAPNELVLVTGGKLTPAKRTEVVIEAVCALANRRVHLVVFGEADRSNQSYGVMLNSMAAAAGNVHMVGWQNAAGVLAYLNMADVAVFPASQSVLWHQAIGMGLPIIAGDRQGHAADYLNLHENIVIIPEHEMSAPRLSREIRRIADDPALRRHMSMSADMVAREVLDWDKLIARTLRFNRERPENSIIQECLD